MSNSEMILYHGSLSEICEPKYGGGQPYHDYGNGFYATEDEALAKEWAVSTSIGEHGYCHVFSLDLRGLKPPLRIDTSNDVLPWMAILMKHRPGTESRRWDLVQKRFIEKYYIDVDAYDVVIGYRANDSYLTVAKQFARGEISVDILDKLLKLGNLGTQVCVKSKDAYSKLRKIGSSIAPYEEYYHQYKSRDTEARKRMKELINSDENDLRRTIEHLL